MDLLASIGVKVNRTKHSNPLSVSVVITELGRTARMYSELSLRTEPTALDVQSALIDAGITMCVCVYVVHACVHACMCACVGGWGSQNSLTGDQ